MAKEEDDVNYIVVVPDDPGRFHTDDSVIEVAECCGHRVWVTPEAKRLHDQRAPKNTHAEYLCTRCYMQEWDSSEQFRDAQAMGIPGSFRKVAATLGIASALQAQEMLRMINEGKRVDLHGGNPDGT